MAASQAHERNGPKKCPWSPEEDRKLFACINTLKESGMRLWWEKVPERAGLEREWKSCHGRWNQYLRPDIKRGNLSQDEIETIIRLQARHGNKWAYIARQLGRTDSEIKNFWNTRLKQKIGKRDIPPQPLQAAAVSLGFHSDAQQPNLHSLHNPVVQQGFGDITPDPEAIGGFNPDPKVNNNYAADLGYLYGNVPNAGWTPALMVSTAASLWGYANLQSLHDPVHSLHNQVVQQGFSDITPDPEATGVLIPDPKINNNYAADLGSLYGNVPNASSTPALMVSTAASLRGYANLHSLHNLVVQQGFSDITPDPEATGVLTPDPKFNNNYAADLGFMFRTPALMVSESWEWPMTNQVENVIIPLAQEISPSEAWPEAFLSGESATETSDPFCGEIALL